MTLPIEEGRAFVAASQPLDRFILRSTKRYVVDSESSCINNGDILARFAPAGERSRVKLDAPCGMEGAAWPRQASALRLFDALGTEIASYEAHLLTEIASLQPADRQAGPVEVGSSS